MSDLRNLHFCFRSRCFLLAALLVLSFDLSYAGSHFISLKHPSEDRMLDPSFWIERSGHTDIVLMTSSDIDRLNQEIRTTFQAGLILLDETVLRSGAVLRRNLRQEYDNLSDRLSTGPDTRGNKFSKSLLQNLALERIAEDIPVRYGIVTRFCDQRLLPTTAAVVADPESRDIDLVQNSALDIGTPVRILHESRDGLWLFVHCDISAGWVKRNSIAACDRDAVNRFIKPDSPVVFLQPKAPIRKDGPPSPHVIGWLRMGASLPFAGDCLGPWISVWVPQRTSTGDLDVRKGWVFGDDVRIGFLPLTSRNIINQAFRMLGAPYGWGGKGQAQDCSRLIQEIFATMGLMLPRNSGDQARVLETIASFGKEVGCLDRMDTIRCLTEPGGGLIYLKGHIMLYLGSVGESVYVLHATHGYRELHSDSERFVRLNRVVVSDLSLGEGTRKGSLCERLISVHGFGSRR
ncbi:MAG: SH3 domain-containing protein [Thermodesulfobacteriota bacterium]